MLPGAADGAAGCAALTGRSRERADQIVTWAGTEVTAVSEKHAYSHSETTQSTIVGLLLRVLNAPRWAMDGSRAHRRPFPPLGSPWILLP